jgi:hypothetical protein
MAVLEQASAPGDAVANAGGVEGVIAWDDSTGWVCLKREASLEGADVRLCWLPMERRGEIHAIRHNTMVIGAKTGAITVLDFSEMLAEFIATSAR